MMEQVFSDCIEGIKRIKCSSLLRLNISAMFEKFKDILNNEDRFFELLSSIPPRVIQCAPSCDDEGGADPDSACEHHCFAVVKHFIQNDNFLLRIQLTPYIECVLSQLKVLPYRRNIKRARHICRIVTKVAQRDTAKTIVGRKCIFKLTCNFGRLECPMAHKTLRKLFNAVLGAPPDLSLRHDYAEVMLKKLKHLNKLHSLKQVGVRFWYSTTYDILRLLTESQTAVGSCLCMKYQPQIKYIMRAIVADLDKAELSIWICLVKMVLCSFLALSPSEVCAAKKSQYLFLAGVLPLEQVAWCFLLSDQSNEYFLESVGNACNYVKMLYALSKRHYQRDDLMKCVLFRLHCIFQVLTTIDERTFVQFFIPLFFLLIECVFQLHFDLKVGCQSVDLLCVLNGAEKLSLDAQFNITHKILEMVLETRDGSYVSVGDDDLVESAFIACCEMLLGYGAKYNHTTRNEPHAVLFGKYAHQLSLLMKISCLPTGLADASLLSLRLLRTIGAALCSPDERLQETSITLSLVEMLIFLNNRYLESKLHNAAIVDTCIKVHQVILSHWFKERADQIPLNIIEALGQSTKDLLEADQHALCGFLPFTSQLTEIFLSYDRHISRIRRFDEEEPT